MLRHGMASQTLLCQQSPLQGGAINLPGDHFHALGVPHMRLKAAGCFKNCARNEIAGGLQEILLQAALAPAHCPVLIPWRLCLGLLHQKCMHPHF